MQTRQHGRKLTKNLWGARFQPHILPIARWGGASRLKKSHINVRYVQEFVFLHRGGQEVALDIPRARYGSRNFP